MVPQEPVVQLISARSQVQISVAAVPLLPGFQQAAGYFLPELEVWVGFLECLEYQFGVVDPCLVASR